MFVGLAPATLVWTCDAWNRWSIVSAAWFVGLLLRVERERRRLAFMCDVSAFAGRIELWRLHASTVRVNGRGFLDRVHT